MVDHAPLITVDNHDKARLWMMKKTVLMRDLSTYCLYTRMEDIYLGFVATAGCSLILNGGFG